MPATRTAFLAAVGLAGLLLTFHPTILSGFDRMQPEAGDVLLNNYFLEHTYRWAFDADYPYSYWSPGFFYPAPKTFTYSETLVGTAPLYWLLRVGVSETVACQLWILITYALNFVAMVVVLRWFGVNAILTAAGAYLFAFGLVRVDHLTQQQLMPHYFSPFAVWYAWALAREPSVHRWWLLIALGVLQLLASLHLGWFLGVGLLIFAVWTVVVEPGSGQRLWQFIRTRPVAVVTPLLIAGTIVGAYARNYYRGAPGDRSYLEAAMYCPYPDGWFVATPGSLWADHLTPRSVNDFSEKMLFQGFVLDAIFLAAGWYACRRRSPNRGLVLATLGTALVLVILVTRWGGNISLWFLVHQVVPGANAFRAVGRIALVVYMFGTIGGLVGLESFLTVSVRNAKLRSLIFAAIAILVVLEQVRPRPESFDKRDFFSPVESLVPHLTGADAGHVIYDEAILYYRHHIYTMWAGMRVNVPVMNGFSGASPPGYPGLSNRSTIEELIGVLGPKWRGRLVVIHWGPPVRSKMYQVESGKVVNSQ
jgi:hypothetical protein